MDKQKRDTEETDWLQQWIVPEEERRRYTSLPSDSNHRRFRSSNVIDLAAWRNKAPARDQT